MRKNPAAPPPIEGLRASEGHLRLAQEAGGIGTWEWDLASGAMRWSDQQFRNLGLAPRRGGDLFPLLLAATHPEDRGQVERAFAEFRTRLGPLRVELRAVWPGEDIHWIVFLGRVDGDAAGRPARMRGITIDGTRRRAIEEAAEAALRESERRLRELNEALQRLAGDRARKLDASRAQIQAIFDNSPDWLTLFRATKDGRFIYEDLNRATERGYGLERHQVVGRPLEEILGVEAAQLPLQHMRACIETGENQRYTARRTMAGVTRTVDVMFVRVPEQADGDWLIMATARDNTEREAIEQQLAQAQKMEAVGHLTGGIAHDFNNLLTTIIGNLELIGPRLGGDAAATRFLDAAQRAAQNGANLTEQLLAFSRRQHLRPRAVDLNAVVGGMREMLARTIGRTIEVRTELSATLWPALVDPSQIEIAILNLAINARDAMPFGGTLTIETRNLPGRSAGLPTEIAGRDCIRISVRDTGAGMSEEVLRSAIEPFFTTKPVGKGSGLGLSQVYGMVRQLEGSLSIDSALGIGTSVHLFLPRAAAEMRNTEQQATAAAEEAGGGRILVVDDDQGVREITVYMLRQAGHGVAEAESGQAALDALSRGEIYDLLVLDIAMPGMTGVETLRLARQRWPELRALYITGYAEALGAGETRPDGDPLLKKPFRMAELTAAVRRAIDQPRHLPSTSNVVPLKARGI